MTDPAGGATCAPDDIAICREIASRAKANLLSAAGLLPTERQHFFLACYAAMRLIDDAVDDGFLSLPENERERQRESMLAEIEKWEAQCLGMAEAGPLPDPVRRAVWTTARRSDLGSAPWRALAGAMREDVSESGMSEWADFLAYAEGATVAPATIFIYLLAAERTGDGFRYRPERPADAYARDLGIFCYLVHILRDLSKDAERSARLVTIPASLLQEADLTRDGLASAIRERDPGVLRLAAALADHASAHLRAGRDGLGTLLPHLGLREAFALKGLIAIYENLFDRLTSDYFTAMGEASALELSLRRRHLNASDLR